jgi:hypothetical protein
MLNRAFRTAAVIRGFRFLHTISFRRGWDFARSQPLLVSRLGLLGTCTHRILHSPTHLRDNEMYISFFNETFWGFLTHAIVTMRLIDLALASAVRRTSLATATPGQLRRPGRAEPGRARRRPGLPLLQMTQRGCDEGRKILRTATADEVAILDHLAVLVLRPRVLDVLHDRFPTGDPSSLHDLGGDQ